MSGPGRVRRTALLRGIIVVAAVSVVVPMLAAAGPAPAAGGSLAARWPSVQKTRLVPVRVIPAQAHPAPQRGWRPPAAHWPTGVTAAVALAWPRQGAGVSSPAGNAGLADPARSAVTAASLPVRLSPAGPVPSSGAVARAQVQVVMEPRSFTSQLQIAGAVFSLRALRGVPAGGMRVHVSLDYSGFRYAYGGGFAALLHLFELPACALTTPGRPECLARRLLITGNDVRTGEVGAVVWVPPAGRIVIAAMDSFSGSTGDYSASPLSATGNWAAGGSSGGFTFSYPVTVPQAPGGLVPKVSLDYDSQAVDGMTSGQNSQASWIGDGWDYNPGYIQRDYQPCKQTGGSSTDDLCWSSYNVTTVSLNGSTATLVDDATKGWHSESDSGEQITYHASGTANGTTPGDYWVVTAADGTKYYFGYALPGYVSGDTAANAAFTTRVYGPASGDPCYKSSTFSQDGCALAWRWQLDYVVDPHGNAIAYLYKTETNYYAADYTSGTETGNTAYTAAGVPYQVWYGIRGASSIYSGKNPNGTAYVEFDATEDRTDVPPMTCASGCTGSAVQSAPTFFGKYQLSTITTYAKDGSTTAGGVMAEVDQWKLGHIYENIAGAATPDKPLWLQTITRTGEDASAIAAKPIPAITFSGQPYQNLSANPNDPGTGYSPMIRWRMSNIVTETGGSVTITYQGPTGGCVTGTLPTPNANTQQCYPVLSSVQPTTPDWFDKYVVHTITQHDTTGNAPDMVTSYAYSGAAWHYDDDSITRPKYRTWDQWRGFSQVTTTTGAAPDPVTKTVDHYFQGMNGDYMSSGVTETEPPLVSVYGNVSQPDADQYAGQTFEHTVYNGSAMVTDTVTMPWSQQTADQPQSGGVPDLIARQVGTGETQVFTALAAAGVRESDVTYHHDSFGRVDWTLSVPETGDSSQTTCTTTSYATNTTAPTYILNTPAEVLVTPGSACPVTSTPSAAGALVSDTRYYYDNLTVLGDVNQGSVTKIQKITSYSGSTPVLSTVYTATYNDPYGRVSAWAGPNGQNTTLTYSPASGSEPQTISSKDPLGLTTKTTYDTLRDLPLTVTDQAGLVTTRAYDSLGRVIKIWTPGHTTATVPEYTFTYQVVNSGPSYAVTQKLGPNGVQIMSVSFIDSLARPREAQTETADHTDTVVTDTTYNSDGWKALTANPYVVAGPPFNTSTGAANGRLVQPTTLGALPSYTGYSYDGAGRVTSQIAYKAASTETWHTDTSFGGNWVTVTPDIVDATGASGTPVTTYTDGRGMTTDIYQYHFTPAPATPPAAGTATKAGSAGWDHTSYTYYPAGQLQQVTDPAGNQWSYTYDLSGHPSTGTDPDRGGFQTQYDLSGNLTQVTDGAGNTVSYHYDNDNRKTAQYAGPVSAQGTADQTARWTYSATTGQFVSSASYLNGSGSTGAAFTDAVTGYDGYGNVKGIQVTIPSGPLANTYSMFYTYYGTGQLDTVQYGSDGNLPSEKIGYTYDDAANPTSVTGIWAYDNALSYTELGQPQQYALNSTPEPVSVTDSYDPQTNLLSEQETVTGSVIVDDAHYAYDSTGDVTSEADTPASAPAASQVQCFQYDWNQRLNQAWSQASLPCAATPSQSAEAGAAAGYWDQYGYDTANNLTSVTTTPQTGGATTYTDAFPATTGAGGPHAIDSQTVNGPGITNAATSYTYNSGGQVTAIAAPSSATEQLNWDGTGQLPGQLASISYGSNSTAYNYDADGNLLLQNDSGNITLYLPNEQITYTASGGTTSGVRYYTIGGVPIAARSSGGEVDYLIGDQQGTSTLSINSQTPATISRRYYDPFGNQLGPNTAFLGNRGFVGGTTDTATSLTNLGARQYSPQTGTFISPDPMLNPYIPSDLNPYAYAANSPASLSDPSGMYPIYGNCTGSAQYCAAHLGVVTGGNTDGSGASSTPGSNVLPPQARKAYASFYQMYASENGFPQGSPMMVLAALAGFCGQGDMWNGGGPCASAHGLEDRLVSDYENAVRPLAATLAAMDFMGRMVDLSRSGAGFRGLTPEDFVNGDAAVDLEELQCTGASFAARTRVQLANGRSVPINGIRPGDRVLAYDTATGKRRAATVTDVIIREDSGLVGLVVSQGSHSGTVQTTEGHLVWDVSAGRWVPVARLRAGDRLLAPDGGAVTTYAARLETTQPTAWMWDLTVAGLHDFYVRTGPTAILVHNAACSTSGNNSAAVSGKQIHGLFSDFLDAVGNGYSGARSVGNGIRVDGTYLDPQIGAAVPIELKPATDAQWRRATSQIAGYEQQMGVPAGSGQIWLYTVNNGSVMFVRVE